MTCVHAGAEIFAHKILRKNSAEDRNILRVL